MNPRLPVIVVVVAVVATACGDDGGSSGLASGDGYSVDGALAELPAASAPDGNLLIQTGDLAAATELAGLARPDGAEVDAVVDWIGPLTGLPMGEPDEEGQFAPVFVPLANVFNLPQVTRIAEYDEALGWSLVDADAFVEQSTPPTGFAVVAGDFDDDPLSPDLVEVDGSDGVVSFGEGDDLEQNVEEPTAVDPLGRPVRLARDGDRIAVSLSTPLVEEWLAGPDETLADDESLADLAAALDDAGVVAAVLSRVDGGLDAIAGGLSPEQIEELLERIDAQLPEAPFDAIGFGWGAADGEAAITVAYHFANEQAASEAVEPLQNLYADGESVTTDRPISELLTVDEVAADGAVVAVSLTLPDDSRPQVIYDLFTRRDLPFISR